MEVDIICSTITCYIALVRVRVIGRWVEISIGLYNIIFDKRASCPTIHWEVSSATFGSKTASIVDCSTIEINFSELVQRKYTARRETISRTLLCRSRVPSLSNKKLIIIIRPSYTIWSTGSEGNFFLQLRVTFPPKVIIVPIIDAGRRWSSQCLSKRELASLRGAQHSDNRRDANKQEEWERDHNDS